MIRQQEEAFEAWLLPIAADHLPIVRLYVSTSLVPRTQADSLGILFI